MTTSDTPLEFKWTAEERALLQATLRVKVLEEDRIEIEAREPYEPLADLFGLVVLLLGVVVLAHEIVDPTPTMFVWVSFLCLLVGSAIPFGPIQRCRGSVTASMSFFPGTQWCIRHRGSAEGVLELVSPASSNPYWGIFQQQLIFETDIGPIQLARRRRWRWTAHLACHNLLLGRLHGETHTDRCPPAHVANLAEAGALALPRRRYVALWKNLHVVSVGLDSLALRIDSGVFRRFWIIYATNLSLWLVLNVLSAVGLLPEHLPWGSGHYIALRTTMLLGIPLAIGFLQRAWVKRSAGPEQRDVITISKRSSHVLIRGLLGERTFNRADCRVWEGTLGYDADSIEYCILCGMERLVRWRMNMHEVDSDMDILKATVAFYLADPIDSKNQEGGRQSGQ
jgi:hypothetical protein